MEWKLFPDDVVPEQSTFAFHEHRERAPHLEQEWHHGRLETAQDYIARAWREYDCTTLVDLGCGDGGLLSLVNITLLDVRAWGYEFTPANLVGAAERGVDARQLDFANNLHAIEWADITVMTEVLEHVRDPHGILRYASTRTEVLVASSPWNENDLSHDACHVWAWDMEGYAKMITDAGFHVISHVKTGLFQVIMATLVR